MIQDPGRARLLAISAHLDDAVLSFGAGLALARQNGAAVVVYTVFAGAAAPPYSAAAERMHAVWGFSPDQDVSLCRRGEDVAALGHLGVDHRHGRFLDSIYRTLPDGRWLADHVAGGQKLAINHRSPETDRSLVSAIRDDIAVVIGEYEPTMVVSCAAVGGHPDNELTRDATLLAATGKNLPVRLWEDLPYAASGSDAVELPEGFHLGPADFGSVPPAVRRLKFRAVEHYPSQFPMLDGRNKDLFARLEEHARSASPHDGYGETTWPVVRSDSRR